MQNVFQQGLRIACYRSGGLGDGFIATAMMAAIRKHLHPVELHAYGSTMPITTMTNCPACTFVFNSPKNSWRDIRGRYDLIFDLCPLPRVYGNLSNQYRASDELHALYQGYDKWNGRDIVEYYKKVGAFGIPSFFEYLFGLPCSITDAKSFSIPCNMGDKPYATISAGFTARSNPKAWKLEKWVEVVKWLRDACDLEVFQIGVDSEPQIPGTTSMLRYGLHRSIYAVRNSKIHLGSDGFYCHVAAGASKPCIVLWGVTPPVVWGYPSQTHIMAPDADSYWWTGEKWGRDPICTEIMDGIQADAVIDAALKLIDKNEQEKEQPKVNGMP